MSKAKTEIIDSVAVRLPGSGVDFETPQVPVLSETPITPGRLFRDSVYTSRTLVLPDGETVPVAQGRATAVSIKQFEYLNAHPDLQLIEE
jgi:hypothetical protein